MIKHLNYKQAQTIPTIFFILLAFLASQPVNAINLEWDSYRVPIDSDYSLVKIDSVDIFLSRRQGSRLTPVVMPMDFQGLGPMNALAVTDRYLFARHYGKQQRNLLEGDDLLVVDESRQYWFIINKINNDIAGPLTMQQLRKWVSVLRIQMPQDWMTIDQLYQQSLESYPRQAERNRIIGKAVFMGPMNGMLVFTMLLVSFSLLLLPYHHYGIIGREAYLKLSLFVPTIPAALITVLTISNNILPS